MPALGRTALHTVGRLYPLRSGMGRFANTPLAKRLAAGRGVRLTRLRDGSLIMADLDDFVGRAAYYCGDLDAKISWILKRTLRPGDAVLDVGGNMGVVALQAAHYVGPAGVVHAFEPQPDLAFLLEESAQLNGYRHLHVHAIALAAQAGRLRLYLDQINSGAASSCIPDRPETCRSIDVPMARLDEALDLDDLPPLRLLKLDVEGAESQVLRGATRLMERNAPAAVLSEYNHHAVNAGDPPVHVLLRQWDYEVYIIPRAMLRVRPIPLDETDDGDINRQAPFGHDLIALHRGEHHAALARALRLVSGSW